MTLATRRDLYARGVATVVASHEETARGSSGARVEWLNGVAAAVFPNGPERAVYNNALLDRGLRPDDRAAAIEAMERAYDSAGVERYAAWVHESDDGMLGDLKLRGFTFDTSTRAMGMALDDLPGPARDVGIQPVEDWGEYLSYLQSVGVPEGLLADTDPKAYHVLAARIDGANVATAIAFDHDGDCGIFNMSTMPEARRRGIGTALTASHLRDAADRGCSTASLQATEMAEGIYASVGFGDLGRFLEYVPAGAPDAVSIGFD